MQLVNYRIRAFITIPMQWDHCKAFGHVSSVGRRRSRDVQVVEKIVLCVVIVMNVTCCNCGGNHEATSFKCPTRVKENEVAKVRVVQSISYAAAVKRVEDLNGAPEVSMVVDRPSLQTTGS